MKRSNNNKNGFRELVYNEAKVKKATQFGTLEVKKDDDDE